MPVEDINTQAWTVYGQRQLARAYTPPVPDQISWAPWEGVGPGAEVLGDITGRRVPDIGSGAGHHAVHLARAHGARVTGIELSPTQHERATSTHAEVPGVEFAQADVVEYLAEAEPFDAAYSIGTLGYIDPHRALPALCNGLRPGEPLILSLLHTDLNGHGPSTEVAPREQMILLRDDPPLPTHMWVLTPQVWEDLLTEYGFRVEAIDLLHHPDDSTSVIQQLIRARRLPDRRTRVSSRPRSTRPPVAHAAVGVGAACPSLLDLPQAKSQLQPPAPPAATPWTALGGLTTGAALLLRLPDGLEPDDSMIHNLHLLDALNNFLTYLGFALILIALLTQWLLRRLMVWARAESAGPQPVVCWCGGVSERTPYPSDLRKLLAARLRASYLTGTPSRSGPRGSVR